jgi:hypothetical protein
MQQSVHGGSCGHKCHLVICSRVSEKWKLMSLEWAGIYRGRRMHAQRKTWLLLRQSATNGVGSVSGGR